MERDISAATPQPVYQLAPEQIAGPYFRNPKLLRRNISEGAEGLPLLLRLTIVDAMTGEPVSGALVDIWHCNARAPDRGGAGSIRIGRSTPMPSARSRVPMMTPTCAAASSVISRDGRASPPSIRGSMPVGRCTFMWPCAWLPAVNIWMSATWPGSVSCIFPRWCHAPCSMPGTIAAGLCTVEQCRGQLLRQHGRRGLNLDGVADRS